MYHFDLLMSSNAECNRWGRKNGSAIIGGADPATERRLAEYGAHLGTAFQLIDDVLDYSGAEAETGKHLGDDLAEGKPTLPLIYVMQHGTPEQAVCVRNAIEQGGRDDFLAVLDAVRAAGALEHAKVCAKAEADLAACLGCGHWQGLPKKSAASAGT